MLYINYHPGTMDEEAGYTILDDVEYMLGDIQDLVEAVQGGYTMSCPLEGAADALQDGGLWQDSQQAAIEDVYHEIMNFVPNQTAGG